MRDNLLLIVSVGEDTDLDPVYVYMITLSGNPVNRYSYLSVTRTQTKKFYAKKFNTLREPIVLETEGVTIKKSLVISSLFVVTPT